jgi:7-carboxy-7-deazaguanine synthase
MLISEIYSSRQGEGLLTGTPSVFIRTAGCNLRCGFCDTPFASWEPDGQRMTIPEIVSLTNQLAKRSLSAKPNHVVITGGEPMLPNEINELCQKIRATNFHITIETAGTLFRRLECDLMSVSPKLSNSDPDRSRAGEWKARHQQSRHRPKVVRQLIEQYEYQLKFVVGTPSDLDEILNFLQQVEVQDHSRVMLMPQGVDSRVLQQRAQWLVPLCEQLGFTFCPRKHIEWFGNKRGT